MSFLVELPREAYPDNAIDKFSATATQFSLDNARTMMWLSQLAYETAHKNKIDDVLRAFKLTRRGFGSNDPITGLPPKSASFVVAGGRGATIVTFSGTDPLKIQDWITDFTVVPEPNVLHAGFHDAVETVWPAIKAAIEGRPATEQELFFTGHSLGGALAVIAAERAMREASVQPRAVYTFGGPRVGGQTFFNQYTQKLGNSTFRLVHGHDIVPTVPPTLKGDFRHVGQMEHCSSGSQFDGLNLEPHGANNPDIVQNDFDEAHGLIEKLRKRDPFPDLSPVLLDPLAIILPPMVLDHIPASYFAALSIRLR